MSWYDGHPDVPREWPLEGKEVAVTDKPASRRLHLHFLHSPVEITGADGKVSGMKFERNELDGSGRARGTGEIVHYPVQAVYRSVGYFGSAPGDVEFDHQRGVVRNEGGRVLDADGKPVPGIYATGWIKRGPVGLISHTKGYALETVTYLLHDLAQLPAARMLTRPPPSDCSNPAAFTTPVGRAGSNWTAMKKHLAPQHPRKSWSCGNA